MMNFTGQLSSQQSSTLKLNKRLKFLGSALFSLGLLSLATAAQGQSFTLASTPSALTIYPGQQNVPVTVAVGSSSYTGPITVTLTGLPSGITASPLTLMAGSSGILNLSATVSAGQEGFPPPGGEPSMVTSWTAAVKVLGAAGPNVVTSTLSLTVSISDPSFAPATSAISLPILRIDTGGTPIISTSVNVPGTVTIMSPDGQTSYIPNSSDTNNTATFHVHGNSTANEPKLAYHMKLSTSLDLLTTMGLHCPYVTSKGKPVCDKSKSYHLIANYDDKTALRDWAASTLANSIPIGNGYLNSPADSPTPSGTSTLMPWAPHSLFVELYLNGLYEGNYELFEDETSVDNNKVDITELTESDTAPADVTGGYLMEIDQRKKEAYTFVTPQGVDIGLEDPDFTPDPEVPQQTTYITQYMDTAENALFASNFTDPMLGWRAYFDEASAVNFYIVNDLMGNEDGGDFFSSDYLYKNANNPLIYMGPVWDFNTSGGNSHYTSDDPVLSNMQQYAVWYKQWFKDPGFKADVITQWNTLKSNGVFDTWLASIQQEAQGLEQSEKNNYQRWPNIGIEVPPNTEAAGTYDGEVAFLISWLKIRMAFLDSQFNNRPETQTTLSTPSGALRTGSQIALTATVSGGISPSGTVSFLSNYIPIGSAILSGGTAVFTTTALPAGTDILEAVYTGDSSNALSTSTSQSITVASALGRTVTSVAGIVANGFSALVVANSGTAIPTGTVTFSGDAHPGVSVPLNGAGQASVATSALGLVPHIVAASYSGDGNYAASIGTLIISVPPPVFSLPPGTYASGEALSISNTAAGSVIYYTTDGSTPTTNSKVYTGSLSLDMTETIRAIAVVSGYGSSQVASAAYTVGTQPLTISLAPVGLTFTATNLGAKSTSQNIAVTNTGASVLVMRSYQFSGGNASMFRLIGKTCSTSLAIGASCNLTVSFVPTAAGTFTASLLAFDNASGSPQAVALTGTLTAPGSVSLAPASLTFPQTYIGSTSASQTITVTNTGTVPVAANSYVFGGANPSEFLRTSKTCVSSLAAGNSCTLSIAFRPTSVGNASASLMATDSAANSPQTIALAGTGVVADRIAFSPVSLTFPSTNVGSTSASQTLTVTNTGMTSVMAQSYLFTGTNSGNFWLTAKTCNNSLAAHASCTLSIAFRPSAAGDVAATLTATDSGVGSPQTIPLEGTATVMDRISVLPTSLSFPSTNVGSSSASQTLTVTNAGTTAVTVQSYHFTGTNPSNFLLTAKTCNTSLAAGATCTLSIAFRPSAVGGAAAALTATDGGVGSPQTIPLAGTGTEEIR